MLLSSRFVSEVSLPYTCPGGLVNQDRTADLLAIGGKDGAALALNGVPGVPAQLAQLEPSVVCDLLDHRPQGVHMCGQRAGLVSAAARQGRQQATFAVAVQRKLRKLGQGLLGEGDARPQRNRSGWGCLTGRTGCPADTSDQCWEAAWDKPRCGE